MPVYKITLVPTCTILDDRKCECHAHATYEFKGIEAGSLQEAVEYAREYADATETSHAIIWSGTYGEQTTDERTFGLARG